MIRTIVVVSIGFCLCGCSDNSKKGKAAGAGSVITASSGSPFKIDVAGVDANGATCYWTCNSKDDCSTVVPGDSSFVLTVNSGKPITVPMNPGWSIDIHPHFAKLQVVGNVLHAYANQAGDSWTPNSQVNATSIQHNSGSQVDRIIITDPTARTPEDGCNSSGCKLKFTVGN